MISILEEAAEIISGARQDDYGTPEESFSKIASMWNTYLIGNNIQHITEQDVAIMMILLKVSRVNNGATDDTLVDIAGYAAIASTLD